MQNEVVDMEQEFAAIEKEIADFEEQRARCLELLRSLAEQEDMAGGVFRHEEIHAAKQEKLRLDFEIQFRKGRMSRMRYASA
ncbi:MAG: hypothetical protein ACLGSA_01785 [Acidobacteriota bacterium]